MRIDGPNLIAPTATGAANFQSISLTATGMMPSLLLSDSLSLDDHVGLISNPANDEASGIIVRAPVNMATGTIGIPMYMATGGSFEMANATDVTKAPAQGLNLDATGTTRRVLLMGTITNTAWDWSVGPATGAIYLSATAGMMTQVRPANTDEVIQVLGWALTADTMMFNPSPDYVTHV